MMYKIMSNKSYSPAQVANSFLKLSHNCQQGLDPLKIQKLIFFAHGWSLALDEISLINEPFHAWRFGPVISSVYHEFKQYGNNPIKHFMSELVESENNSFSWSSTFITPDDRNANELIKKIFDNYGKFSGSELSNMTHEKGTPWYCTYHRGIKEGIKNGKEILNNEIKKYFNHLAEQQIA